MAGGPDLVIELKEFSEEEGEKTSQSRKGAEIPVFQVS